MNSRVLLGLCLAGALCVAGCRQPDGALPKAEGDVPNRVGDLGRDLQNVAGGDKQAPQDLRDDLIVFLDNKRERFPSVEELSRKTSDALVGKKLSDQNAQQLAQQLWTTVAGRQLSDKQVQNLQKDVQTTLTAVGVADDRAKGVVTQVANVQKTVTERKRRWYEWF
jgi:hypothetical protein